MDTLPNRLKALREKRELTQQDVADGIGVDRSTLAGYELGRSNPEHKYLLALAEYFRVSLDYLTGRTVIPEPAPDDDDEIYAIRRSMTGLSEAERQDILEYAAWKREQLRRKGRTSDASGDRAVPDRGPPGRGSQDTF